VRSVAFDRTTHTLRVELGSGDVYDFADVPERLYDELGHTPDRDAFFRQHICDEFSATRVGDVDLGQHARERREDAILGAPLAEQVPLELSDERVRIEESDAHRSHHTWLIDVLDEDSVAVQIDGRQITPLPRWLLPADAHDGDVLRVTHDRSGSRSTISIRVAR
jgi:hypothetical protein